MKMGARDWNSNTDAPSNVDTSAGGGYSTVGDLLRFADALRENKLLDAQYTKLMTTGRVATPFGFEAYGFGVQTINGNQCFGHNGRARESMAILKCASTPVMPLSCWQIWTLRLLNKYPSSSLTGYQHDRDSNWSTATSPSHRRCQAESPCLVSLAFIRIAGRPWDRLSWRAERGCSMLQA